MKTPLVVTVVLDLFLVMMMCLLA